MEQFCNSMCFYINGKKIVLSGSQLDPKATLLQYLRAIGLTGTKLGCGEGGCGACTVMLSRFNFAKGQPEHYSANACLTPLCSLDCIAVTTIEGIGSMKEGLHPIQQRISSMHGSQCGFCTPGIVMALYAQLRGNPDATPHEIEESMDGNLCRCTGYRPIIDAARSLSNNKRGGSNSLQSEIPSGCCRGKGGQGGCPCAEVLKFDSDVIDHKHSCSEHTINAHPSVTEDLFSRSRSEPIFPPALMHVKPKPLCFTNTSSSGQSTITWYQPLTLAQLLQLKTDSPDARLIVGNTEVGIEVKFKAMEYRNLINPSYVPELQVLHVREEESKDSHHQTTTTAAGVVIGAAVTINGLRQFIESVETAEKTKYSNNSSSSYRMRGLTAIRHMLTWFASNHIRNVACVGGNIATASPISDLNPMLIACGAVLTITSLSRGSRNLPISSFFLSYRKVDLQPDEIIENVFIPFTKEFEFVLPFKQARRREDDISIVTAGLRINLQVSPAVSSSSSSSMWSVESCTLSFGGMAPTTICAPQTATALIGNEWSYQCIQSVFSILRSELSLPSTVPGGQAEYRMSLAVSFLLKAYLTMTSELGQYIESLSSSAAAAVTSSEQQQQQRLLPAVPSILAADLSGTRNFLREPKASSRSEQGYFARPSGQHLHAANPLTEEQQAHVEANAVQTSFPAPTNPVFIPPGSDPAATAKNGEVGKPLMHKNAEAQVTGATKYADDMPLPANAVHACLVTSTRVHARLVSVDTVTAEHCPGFVAYFCAKDVVGSNHMGAIIRDEEVFCESVVQHYGAIIGVVLANTHEQAVYAARQVKVEYADIIPAIISITDAIAHKSFYPAHHVIESGDLTAEQTAAEIHVSGTGKIGGQEHFYLETNCAVALPSETGYLEIYSSTQNLAETQKFCSSVCGLPASKVLVKCKRMGGGFGGKESRSVPFACVAALSAHLLERPVSINIERDVDMSITGQRHAFLFNYKAGVNRDGTLRYLDVELYSNAGFSLDLSQPVLDRALFHVDNVYRWPALRASGRVCRTNQPSHTAFRGFGGPQGMIVTETVMLHLAEAASLSLDDMKRQNMYREGDITHFGQKLEYFYVPDLWEKAIKIADVTERKAAVAEYNRANNHRKRGLALTATKFGINFTAKFMNQAGALVHLYVDGSVLVAHGGTEMGQGLHTKMIQVAAQCFGISEQFVSITETATNTVSNASPTAASMSTDLFGMAVLDACEQLKQRLAPLRAKLSAADDSKPVSWPDLVHSAYYERIDLSAHGFYAVHTDRCGYNWDLVGCSNNSQRGHPFNYFSMGVACTEVEIDCLTGDSQILRADILMDVGKSINPAIDIGQIEGAYIQGYGWSTMEELVWGDANHAAWVRPGQLFTKGPGTYKIPAFNDVPVDFRVHLSDTDNRFAVHSAKAVGEPPFFLGASAFFAIKEAIVAARSSHGYNEYYQLDLPATSERIRMACSDNIVTLACNDVNKNQSDDCCRPGHYHVKGSW